jgi:secondary thiamine-phosphate synthase enzyme
MVTVVKSLTWIGRDPIMDHQGSPQTRLHVMKVHQEVLSIATTGRGFVDISSRVEQVVADAKVSTGLCTLFIQHTSASLVIQENAAPSVRRDLERWIGEIAPEDANAYEHDDEGIDDMPAHLRSAIMRTSEVIPVREGMLALGTWQAIYVWEHRRSPHERNVIVHVQGA